MREGEERTGLVEGRPLGRRLSTKRLANGGKQTYAASLGPSKDTKGLGKTAFGATKKNRSAVGSTELLPSVGIPRVRGDAWTAATKGRPAKRLEVRNAGHQWQWVSS